jgi:hypothetical protein
MVVAEELASALVLDVDAQPVRLGELWAKRPVILVFVRHFGCLFCREQAVQIRDVFDRLRAAGADVAFVGSGTPDQAEMFRSDYDLPFPVYVDPSLRAFRIARLERGVGRTLGPGSLAAGLRAFRAGYRQGHTEGDPWQLGGAIVVGPGHKVFYAYRSATAGDHPDPEALIAALPTDA